MINLSDAAPFAEGGNRKCYVHPNNPNRCLKVVHPGLLQEIKKNKPWYKRFRSIDSFDDNLREEKAYNQKALTSNNPNIGRDNGIAREINNCIELAPSTLPESKISSGIFCIQAVMSSIANGMLNAMIGTIIPIRVFNNPRSLTIINRGIIAALTGIINPAIIKV